MPLTHTGPQAFAFENPDPLDAASRATATSLRPFPSNLTSCRVRRTARDSKSSVKSRPTGGAYLPRATPLHRPMIRLGRPAINITVKQVPGDQPGTC